MLKPHMKVPIPPHSYRRPTQIAMHTRVECEYVHIKPEMSALYSDPLENETKSKSLHSGNEAVAWE